MLTSLHHCATWHKTSVLSVAGGGTMCECGRNETGYEKDQCNYYHQEKHYLRLAAGSAHHIILGKMQLVFFSVWQELKS